MCSSSTGVTTIRTGLDRQHYDYNACSFTVLMNSTFLRTSIFDILLINKRQLYNIEIALLFCYITITMFHCCYLLPAIVAVVICSVAKCAASGSS